jgi:cell fate (sporulation/competence/biofilm development) regulator YmcA (YheA/YmcA/DUF963 family)
LIKSPLNASLKFSGKKSKEEAEQLYSDIKQSMSSQPEFNNFEQSQTKINQFIQS